MLDDQRQAAGLDPQPRPGDDRGASERRDIIDLKRSQDEAPAGDEGDGKSARGSGRDAGADGEDDANRPGILKRYPWWFVLGGIAVVAVGIAGFFYWQIDVHPYESTDDAFVEARQFSVAPKVSGYVVAVPVTDNQHVETGAPLFRIDPRDYQVALEQAQAQIASATAAIRNVDAQVEAQKAQVEVAKAQVTQNQAALDFAKEDAARYKDLASRGAGTVQQSQSSTSTLEQRQAALASSDAGVVQAEKQVGSLQAQRASAEANLANAQAQAAQARLNLGYTTVTAAQPGRVVQLTGAVGQYAQAGQALAMFVPDEKWVVANYKETQITDMRPGQPARIEIDAYPDRRITGKVASVQPGSGTAFSLLPAQNATGNYVKVVQRVPVKIVVDSWPQDVSIGPGMSIVPTVRVR